MSRFRALPSNAGEEPGSGSAIRDQLNEKIDAMMAAIEGVGAEEQAVARLLERGYEIKSPPERSLRAVGRGE